VRDSTTEYLIEQVMNNIKQRFLTEEENVVNAEKFFVAASVIRDAVYRQASGEISEYECKTYFIAIEKYLTGEIEMFWEDGIVKVKKPTNYTDEYRRKALDSLQKAYREMIGEPSHDEME
tara:strand:+ start:116 stop:475 length:360 start_codon:yes stop_codon:yes gene_type:complete